MGKSLLAYLLLLLRNSAKEASSKSKMRYSWYWINDKTRLAEIKKKKAKLSQNITGAINIVVALT